MSRILGLMEVGLGCSLSPAMRQKFFEVLDRMFGDAAEYVFEPGKRIDANEFAGGHKTAQHGRSLASVIAAEEGYASDQRSFVGYQHKDYGKRELVVGIPENGRGSRERERGADDVALQLNRGQSEVMRVASAIQSGVLKVPLDKVTE